MALIECPDCKKQISEMASSCPVCGRPSENHIEEADSRVTAKRRHESRVGLGSALAIIGTIIYGVYPSSDPTMSTTGVGLILVGILLFLSGRWRLFRHHG